MEKSNAGDLTRPSEEHSKSPNLQTGLYLYPMKFSNRQETKTKTEAGFEEGKVWKQIAQRTWIGQNKNTAILPPFSGLRMQWSSYKNIFTSISGEARDRTSNRCTYSFGTVKKGHFPVVVLSNGQVQKPSVPFRYLVDPFFIRLLNDAERIWTQSKGVLVIPCQAGMIISIPSEKHIGIVEKPHKFNLELL